MNQDRQGPDPAPGSGAGDAASSQAIPRMSNPVATSESKSAAGGSNGVKKAATKKAAASKTTAETDKGRPRDRDTPTNAPGPSIDEEPKQRRVLPVTADRPMTAADYARTTTPSPSTTAVIPAVTEEPSSTQVPAAVNAAGRQANLRLNHVEPWSVTRIAFAVSVAMMIVGVVAMTIFWIVLNITGVWDQVNDAVTSVLSDNSSSFDITDYLGFWRLIGLTLVLSAINVVLMTALATIGAHLYNLAAQVLGGVEVTFGEDS